MAGIGFEIRKIFGKKTLASSTWGVIYASVTTIGPSLVFIALMFLMRYVLDFYNATEKQELFFTASFTYAFLIAILTSALINPVVSRYISDKIFVKKESDIGASLFGTLTLSSVISGVFALYFCVRMIGEEFCSPAFIAAYYILIVLAAGAYTLIAYVSALKEYKEVTFSYLLGVVLAVPVFFLLFKLFDWSIITSIYWALVVGFTVINLLLVYYCVKAFGVPDDGKYFEFLGYFKKFPKLAITGFCYLLGFYISNIIYWNLAEDISVTIGIFKIAPNYDMAFFLAILVNLSAMVVFEVKTETVFYEKYITYLSAIDKGSYDRLEKERITMQNVINLQLFFVYEVQLIITIILICLINIFHPYLGISSQVLNMFILLGMGVYCLLCMYFTIIFLYYFEDHTASAITSLVFLAVLVIGSLICCDMGTAYYPLPVLAGGIAGWITGFVLLRKRIKNLNSYLFCR